MENILFYKKNYFFLLFFLFSPCFAAGYEPQRIIDSQGVEMVYPRSAKSVQANTESSSEPRISEAKKNDSGRGAVKVSPNSFPKVSQDVQSSRDSARQKILQTELSNEKKNLDEKLKSSNDSKNSDSRLVDEIRRHERNIELLTYELKHIGKISSALAGVGDK